MFRPVAAALVALPLALAHADGASQSGDDAVAGTVRTCFACHGVNGASTDPQYPILAGQELYYLYL